MTKWRGIRDLDYCGNGLFRCPERVARGCLIRFPRWSKSRIPRLFHRIKYLYYTSLSVWLSATAKYCSSALEGYRSKQDCRYWHPVNIFWQILWLYWTDCSIGTVVLTPLSVRDLFWCTTVRSIAPPSLDDLFVLIFHSTTCIVLLVSYVLCIFLNLSCIVLPWWRQRYYSQNVSILYNKIFLVGILGYIL